MARVTVDPVTRIEGHLKLEVELDSNNVVTDAWVGGALWRGLELIMQGRDPRDAEQIMQRICGVCPTGHATAGILALDDAFGIVPTPNGRIIRNLILGSNFIQSHILHFFHLAALDYVNAPDTIAPFKFRYNVEYKLPKDINDLAVKCYLDALTMRRKAQEMLAIWGGKMPHVQAIVPGGVSEVPDTSKIYQFLTTLEELTAFIDGPYKTCIEAVKTYYPEGLDIGVGCKNMLAYGAFPQNEDPNHLKRENFFPPGIFMNKSLQALDPKQITEDVTYSWYKNGIDPSPEKAVVAADRDKKDAYSWLKAPRYNGIPMEVGPLARQIVAQNKDVLALGDKAYSVIGRHFARWAECSQIAHEMPKWALQLKPGDPVATPHKLPTKEVVGMGLTEAARGALGHWHRISSSGRTMVYNAVVPTTWNASPRTGSGAATVNGPMEQSIIGTKVADPANPVNLVRIIRSYDPCFGCAIHLMTPDKKTISQFVIN